jgi:CHAT domain-containing protein
LIVDNPEPETTPLHTAAEVAAARQRFPDHSWLAGPEATVASTSWLVPDHDVVHFACHGEVRLEEPLETALRLAGGESLLLRDLLRTRIDVRLAVLSACDTNVSGYRHAHESVSLASTFLLGGAAGVIASLWRVPDAATDILMAAFHTRWTEDTPPAEALRHAQRWMRTATNREIHAAFPAAAGKVPEGTAAYRLWAEAVAYHHPYFWAGFSYTGR